VVVILLESCGEIFHEVMPNFNQLKREGIWFSNFYGNSFRTDRGTVCALSGYPSFPTTSVMKIPKKAGTLPSIAKTLQKEGYTTSYLYGGDINFTNMRSYLIATGWEKLHCKADYTSEEQRSAEWGVRDDITFKTLFYQICASDTTGHFLMGYSTLSSHEPWDVPIQKYDDKEKNAFSYLDDCIGKFVSQLKATPYWRDLLIVMIPDHGVNYKDIDETRQVRNHIPMLWVGGAVKAPKEIKTICNQTDLPATLLGQMGFPHGEFSFSRDVTSQNYTKPLAFHSFTNGFSIVDSTGFTVVDLNIDQVIVNQSKDPQRHMKLGKAILQVTAKDLKER
jgi:phosphoglycerol transferase MdoB-like AlkP superfamily enzyme